MTKVHLATPEATKDWHTVVQTDFAGLVMCHSLVPGEADSIAKPYPGIPHEQWNARALEEDVNCDICALIYLSILEADDVQEAV